MKRRFLALLCFVACGAVAQPPQIGPGPQPAPSRNDFWQRLTREQQVQLWRTLTPEQRFDLWRSLNREDRQALRERSLGPGLDPDAGMGPGAMTRRQGPAEDGSRLPPNPEGQRRAPDQPNVPSVTPGVTVGPQSPVRPPWADGDGSRIMMSPEDRRRMREQIREANRMRTERLESEYGRGRGRGRSRD